MSTKTETTIVRRELEWGGKTLRIELGRYAAQATASATVQYGDTVVLATVVMGKEPREGVGYFPLVVDYEERLYAAGKIKGSRFIKREGRPSDEAILAARLIDRSVRPLFDSRIRNDVQLVLTVLSFDGENDSDIPSLVAGALVLSLSDVPWSGPIAGARVGRVNGEWVLNPSYEAREKSDLDLIISGTKDKVAMVEAGASQMSEADFYDAMLFGQKHLGSVVALIEDLQQQYGKEKRAIEAIIGEEEPLEAELQERVETWGKQALREKFFVNPQATKADRKQVLGQLKNELDATLTEDQIGKERRAKALTAFDVLAEAEVSRMIIEEDKRVDSRALTEVRTLQAEVGLLPRTHGSGLFARGETQVLSVVTLGSPGDEQTLDTMEESGKKHYMHHYNFPPYSVGEVGRIGSPGRREIGHGALAEKALLPVLPSKEDFPYTVRVVSEVMGSNGSSSMASTCGSTLALMDAGVPISAPVAGVAMGIATNESGNWKILTDLQDLEDGKGGMDFKVAGTRDGITAVQMDTKTHGITNDMVEQTLTAAKNARLVILESMEQAIAEPRPEMSPYAPRIETIKINPDRIRDIIGPGGKMINEIIDQTGVSMDVEKDGTVIICSADASGLERAVKWVHDLTKEVEVGELYTGTVTRILNFGAFVEILPKKEGLVHISELAPQRVESVEDVVKVGQEVKVKVIEIDELGRVNLSMKQAEPTDVSSTAAPHRGETKGTPGTRPPQGHSKKPAQQ